MNQRNPIARVWSRILSVFRKKPVVVERILWDAECGCEKRVLVVQGKLYPGMRIFDALDDLHRGVKFSRGDMRLLKMYCSETRSRT